MNRSLESDMPNDPMLNGHRWQQLGKLTVTVPSRIG